MESASSGEMLDLAAFDRLFGEYRPRFIRFAASYVTDAAVAEDIVMESFMAASCPPFGAEPPALRAGHRPQQVPQPPACASGAPARRGAPPFARRADARTPHLDPRGVRTRAALFGRGPEAGQRDARPPARPYARGLRPQPLPRRELQGDCRRSGNDEVEISKAMRSLRVSLKDYLPLLMLFLLIDK